MAAGDTPEQQQGLFGGGGGKKGGEERGDGRENGGSMQPLCQWGGVRLKRPQAGGASPHIAAELPHIAAELPHTAAALPHIAAELPHIAAASPHVAAASPPVAVASPLTTAALQPAAALRPPPPPLQLHRPTHIAAASSKSQLHPRRREAHRSPHCSHVPQSCNSTPDVAIASPIRGRNISPHIAVLSPQ